MLLSSAGKEPDDLLLNHGGDLRGVSVGDVQLLDHFPRHVNRSVARHVEGEVDVANMTCIYPVAVNTEHLGGMKVEFSEES